jgi:hypothetical protein
MDIWDSSPRLCGKYARLEGGHIALDAHKGSYKLVALHHTAAEGIEQIFRNYTKSLQTLPPCKYCKHPCGKAPGMCAFRISASGHIRECRYALPRCPHQQGGDEA